MQSVPKKTRVAVERKLEAQALLQSEEATSPHSEGEESDLEVSGSEMKAMWNPISKVWTFI